ncbi:uncharacterized protein [Bombus fervidus]|uniref:uncharacterized protein n=1 Tax=Bombus fervidus TaxID=203811 RepID=UPI003D1891D2
MILLHFIKVYERENKFITLISIILNGVNFPDKANKLKATYRKFWNSRNRKRKHAVSPSFYTSAVASYTRLHQDLLWRAESYPARALHGEPPSRRLRKVCKSNVELRPMEGMSSIARTQGLWSSTYIVSYWIYFIKYIRLNVSPDPFSLSIIL